MKLEQNGDAMKTAEELKREFDKSASGGIKCLKAVIKDKQDLVKRKLEHAGELEKKVAKMKEDYKAATENQEVMRQQITDNEERLEQIEKRKAEIKKRLDEKEETLREVVSFTAHPSIEIAAKVESRLAAKKQLWKENNAKFLAAREKKKELETRKAMVECKSRAMTSKVNYLKTEIHHANLKEERLKQEKLQLEEIRSSTTTKCKEIEEGIEVDSRKVAEAKIRVSSLQANIESKEDEILSMSINRKKLEGTIVNILTKIKEQHEKNRHIDVAYTLNKDSFVV